MLDALDAALDLPEDMQTAYSRGNPNERRLFNQAFFERIEIAEESVVRLKLAQPFDQLKGSQQATEADKAALAARLGPG